MSTSAPQFIHLCANSGACKRAMDYLCYKYSKLSVKNRTLPKLFNAIELDLDDLKLCHKPQSSNRDFTLYTDLRWAFRYLLDWEDYGYYGEKDNRKSKYESKFNNSQIENFLKENFGVDFYKDMTPKQQLNALRNAFLS